MHMAQASDQSSSYVEQSTFKRGDHVEFTALGPSCFRVISGWAAAYIETVAGCRQIVAFHLPGDAISDLPPIGPNFAAGIVALSELHLAPTKDAATHCREATLTAWLINVGKRTAVARISHLLCELHARVSALAGEDLPSFQMPLLQEDLADAVGMTPVHANRMLRELRQRGLATVTFKGVSILDLSGLRELAGFDGEYLRRPKGPF